MDLCQKPAIKRNATTQFYNNWKSTISYYKNLIRSKQRTKSSSGKALTPSTKPTENETRNPESDQAFTELVCTNCYSYISTVNVDSHSKICTKPLSTQDIKELSLVNLRICKLIDAIRRSEREDRHKILKLAHKSLEETDYASIIKSLDNIIWDDGGVNMYARHLMYLVDLKQLFHSPTQTFTSEDFKKWRHRSQMSTPLL